jgi:hypothetical protein
VAHGDFEPTGIAVEGSGAEIEQDSEHAVRHAHARERPGLADLLAGRGGVEQGEAQIKRAFGRLAGVGEVALVGDAGAG